MKIFLHWSIIVKPILSSSTLSHKDVMINNPLKATVLRKLMFNNGKTNIQQTQNVHNTQNFSTIS